MTTYQTLSSKISFISRHCFCCCVKSDTTVYFQPTHLTIHTVHYNQFGCTTANEERLIPKSEIASVKYTSGCWYDPTPCDFGSVLFHECDCLATHATMNVSGVNETVRLNQRDASVITDWWKVPPSQEML
jgi:hypothetical protein